MPDNKTPGNKHWYALYTKPRSEFKAAAQLELLNIENYLPLSKNTKQWSDRQKIVTEPLISGYIFICTTEKERLVALKQPMIIRCVSDHGRAARIPEWQIDNLKLMLESGTDVTVKEEIVTGTEIEILDGPFKGMIGKILFSGKDKMIAVTIDLLNRSVITHLPKKSRIKKISKDDGINADSN